MSKPAWRTAFDRLERAVGAPLEDMVASERYIDFVVYGLNGPIALNRMLRRTVDRQLAHVLHLLNMPSRDDYARLSKQLAVLTAEVRALSVPADQISGYLAELQRREAELERTTALALSERAESAEGGEQASGRPARARGADDGT